MALEIGSVSKHKDEDFSIRFIPLTAGVRVQMQYGTSKQYKIISWEEWEQILDFVSARKHDAPPGI